LQAVSMEDPHVWPMVPGVPRDVPPQLQAVSELVVGFRYCSLGGNLDTMHPPEAIPFLYELFEAMGTPVSSMAMFTLSPLRMGGPEFDAAYHNRNRLDGFYLCSLPCFGMSAPIYRKPAWVVSLAEALGGGTILWLLSEKKPVTVNVAMFPYDPRHAVVAGGMSEHMIAEYQHAQINGRYGRGGHNHSMSTGARNAGVQAGAEKAMNAALAVSLGCRSFTLAGTLGFDDIFSPQQFLFDLEIIKSLTHVLDGDAEPEPSEWDDMIAEGAINGYVGVDTTLDQYKRALYLSTLFDRRALSPEALQETDYALRTSAERARALEAGCAYAPDRSKIEPVRQIAERAWTALAPYEKNPLLPLLEV